MKWSGADLYLSAALLRLALIVYGTFHDELFEVRYTDIDYDVFSDGAHLVWRGRSPFERPTYRYTPLLAALLTPNVWLHPAFGKVLFATADLIVGALIQDILTQRQVPGRMCAAFWLYNPLALNVSTRGNGESLVAVLLLGSLHALLHRRLAAAGALLGCAVHLKPYPVIYVPAFLFALDAELGCAVAPGASAASAVPAPPRSPLIARARFLSAAGAAVASLSFVSFIWCGWPFVSEALVYHVSRQDVRHNFSPYFYLLYLAEPQGMLRRAASALAFAPQAVLLVAFAAKFGNDLPFCMLVQTVGFVALNKVCTAQYFVWYLALLPLVLPSSAALQRVHRARTAVLSAFWVGTLLLWLGIAYLLEFGGRPVYLWLWLACLAFFAANVLLLRHIICMHHPTPLFRNGSVAKQVCLYSL